MSQLTEYFTVDDDGYLLSTLMLSAQEAPLYGSLITQVRPPERPVPTPTVEGLWASIRQERSRRLAACDWAVLPDVPMTVERRAQWAAYRQALRDITLQPDPFNIVWPTPPT